GIGQTAGMAGLQTVVREVSEGLIQKGFATIEKSLGKFAEKGTITTEQQRESRERLRGTTSFDDLAECDIIIEAIIENLEEKQNTYRHLVCRLLLEKKKTTTEPLQPRCQRPPPEL